MGRTAREDADYFIHEKGFRDKREMKALRKKYGIVGYGICIMTLETLIESSFIQIELNECQYELLAGDFQIEVDQLQEILTYMITLNLFQDVNGILRSQYLDKVLKGLWKKRCSNLEILRAEGMPGRDFPTISGEFLGVTGRKPEVSDSETFPKLSQYPHSKEKISKKRNREEIDKQSSFTEEHECSEEEQAEIQDAYALLEESLKGTAFPINFKYRPRFTSLCKKHSIDTIREAIELLNENAGSGISTFENIVLRHIYTTSPEITNQTEALR